jgi:hypothetical protein
MEIERAMTKSNDKYRTLLSGMTPPTSGDRRLVNDVILCSQTGLDLARAHPVGSVEEGDRQ